jgi:hypothetical protein
MSTAPRIGRSQVAGQAIDHRLIGNVLLSNTAVCEASRLLLSPPEVPSWALHQATFRARDLMSLIEAAVLHEQIFCLPGTLPIDVSDLELRNRLIADGALAELPQAQGRNVIEEALVASFGTVERFTIYDDGFEELIPSELKGEVIDRAVLRTLNEGIPPFIRRSTVEAIERINAAESFDEAAREVIRYTIFGPTGADDGAITSLRAMYYTFASEYYGLPYLAPASAQPMQRRFPNYFPASMRERIYQQLASALQDTVDKVAQEFDGPIVFVPPFSALVFERAATPAEISSETLALRAEYSDFRRKMSELERDRFEAKSLNDRMKASRQLERLGKEVARPFNQSSPMKLEAALRYIPDAANLAANPTNPVGWARMLLNLPTEALVSWYRRRPVAKLVRTARALGALPDYDVLLTKHFGEAVASSTLDTQSH